MGGGVVIVHVGAGYHSPKSEEAYRAVCQRACERALEVLSSSRPSLRDWSLALDAAVEAVKILEDDPITNAGIGSNLTMRGTVECDAAVMDGTTGAFGAVGAVPSVKNPIELAARIAKVEQQGVLPLGRLPPLLVVGPGAYEYAVELGLETGTTIDDPILITEQRMAAHKNYLGQLAGQAQPGNHDTVGAVVVDNQGHMASAVSSGGLILKRPGRVGDAAIFGCGCYADGASFGPGRAVGVSTTGKGEQIMRTLLGKEIVDGLAPTGEAARRVQEILTTRFLHQRLLPDYSKREAGFVALRRDHDDVEIIWAHTTESLIAAYASTGRPDPHVVISRMHGDEPVLVGVAHAKLPSP